MYDDFNSDLYVPMLRKDKTKGIEFFDYMDVDIVKILMDSRLKTSDLITDAGEVLQINDDRNIYYQNCYAYALGFTAKTWYGPGIISKQDLASDLSDIDVLMDQVEQDLKTLKIGYRRVNKESDKDNLGAGEYLIKVFAVGKECNTTEDYHFIRQDPKSKLWFHKMGKLQPSLFYNGEDKKEFVIEGEGENRKYRYIEAGYFVLSE